jgi:undecaprenyl diphosphate synthase
MSEPSESVSKSVVPRHLGLILDGNRRWARENGVPIAEGHRQGFLNTKKLGRSLFDQGIEYVSAYVFSTENWQRSADEVKQLMKLFMWVAKHEAKELHKDGIRLRVIGSRLRLGKSLVKALHEAEELTKDNTRGTLLLCLDYGGQQEVVDAIKELAANGVNPADITSELISEHLYAPDVPPVDLIIRTSGEQRLSNFMLWRAAYSELMFTKSYWPDFSETELRGMLTEYSTRKRRFGA